MTMDRTKELPDYDKGTPTGKCMRCGGYCYNKQDICSEMCALLFTKWQNKGTKI